MTLDQFKGIFFWEFMHRNWARLMSLVFLFPLLWFLYKKMIRINQLYRILVIVALQYLYPDKHLNYDRRARRLSVFLLCLVFLQIGFGALVAGSKAALSCTTYPLMYGHYLPPVVGFKTPWENFIYENNMMLQFLHRNVAFLVSLFILFFFFTTRKIQAAFEFHRTRWLLLFMVLLQILFGILTLVNSQGKIPVALGVLHQLGAFLLLIFAVEARYFTAYAGSQTRS
jgi:cytochrome c oxidase assembly protein subunit 15